MEEGRVSDTLKAEVTAPLDFTGDSQILFVLQAPQFGPLWASRLGAHPFATFPSGIQSPRGGEARTFPAPETFPLRSRGALGDFHAERAFLGYFLDF